MKIYPDNQKPYSKDITGKYRELEDGEVILASDEWYDKGIWAPNKRWVEFQIEVNNVVGEKYSKNFKHCPIRRLINPSIKQKMTRLF